MKQQQRQSTLWILPVVTSLVGLIGTMFTGYMAFKMAQLKSATDVATQSAIAAAKHVATVATDLAVSDAIHGQQLSKIGETTEKTLVHVNDQYLIQLRLLMEATRTVATLQNSPENMQKAADAERTYKEHESKQAEAREDKMKVDLEKAKAVESNLK